MNKLPFVALGTLSLVFGTPSLAGAASLTKTEFSLTFNAPPDDFDGQSLGICAVLGLCEPGVETVLPDPTPGIPTPPQAFINDTGFAITGILAQLPENRPEGAGVFVDGISDIFSDINISDDGQALSFTGGAIALLSSKVYCDRQKT